MSQPVIDNAKSPKSQLEWLRVLMIPAAINSLVMFPMLLLMSIMGSDSGTDQAIRGSYLAILLVFIHTGAILISLFAWDKASLFASILLTVYVIGNIGVLILFRSTSPLMTIIPWSVTGLAYDSGLRTILDNLVSLMLAIIIPVVSIWRLFRHAFDMDVVDHSHPANLWDLKSINK